MFELLSKPLAERIASLEEENKQLQTRLLQANERLATIKEMANKSNKQQVQTVCVADSVCKMM